MATQADVRRIASSLPDTAEAKDRFAFSVLNKGKPKGFAWVWMERVDPKKPRVANPGVLAVRVANLGQRDDPVVGFTEVLHRAALRRVSSRARTPRRRERC